MEQLARRAAWAGVREPRRDPGEGKSSAGKWVAVLSLHARTQGRPRGWSAAVGRVQFSGQRSCLCLSLQAPPHFCRTAHEVNFSSQNLLILSNGYMVYTT